MAGGLTSLIKVVRRSHRERNQVERLLPPGRRFSGREAEVRYSSQGTPRAGFTRREEFNTPETVTTFGSRKMLAHHAVLEQSFQSRAHVIPPEELGRLDKIVDRYAGQAEHLIPALKDAQDMFGYVPLEVQDRLAAGFNISPARVYGVVTFYSFFTLVPRGRHTIRLCLGTACYVKRSTQILDNMMNELGISVGETSSDGRYTVEAVRCLGACGLAPVMLVGADTHGNMDPDTALEILAGYK